MDSLEAPPLRFLHSHSAPNSVKLDVLCRLPTSELIFSLAPGQQGSLKVRKDGTVLDGHHRLSVLSERGEDIDQLPREIMEKSHEADLFWIPGPWQGRLAIAARPRGGDWLRDEATAWRKAGLAAVVSLLENDEAAQLDLAHEGGAVESAGLRFISFPIPDRGAPASPREAFSLLGNIAAALEQGQNVAVHCRQGIGRSGLVAAGLLVTSGMGVGKAIEVVSAARGLAIPETPEQLEWIKHLPSQKLVSAR